MEQVRRKHLTITMMKITNRMKTRIIRKMMREYSLMRLMKMLHRLKMVRLAIVLL